MNLRDIRKKNNLTQIQVAKYLQTTQQTYSDYENNKTQPSIEMLIRLSELFHISIDSLIREETNNNLKTQNLTFYQQELFEYLPNMNQIECAKVIAYIEGLRSAEKQHNQEQIFKYKGNQ